MTSFHCFVKRSVDSAARIISREVILCIMNRVWVKETRNCICGIVADKLFAPNRFDEF
jgi:hypothetical protein